MQYEHIRFYLDNKEKSKTRKWNDRVSYTLQYFPWKCGFFWLLIFLHIVYVLNSNIMEEKVLSISELADLSISEKAQKLEAAYFEKARFISEKIWVIMSPSWSTGLPAELAASIFDKYQYNWAHMLFDGFHDQRPDQDYCLIHKLQAQRPDVINELKERLALKVSVQTLHD